MLDAVKQHHRMAGDGSISFLLMLHTALDTLHRSNAARCAISSRHL
jgi:hypothetical protein